MKKHGKRNKLSKMKETYNLIKKSFQHIILEGSAYEVGQQQAEILKSESPDAARWFTSANVDPRKAGFNSFEELQAWYEEYCPGITDEILGFAEGLNVKPDRLQLYNPPIYHPGNCSQIAALSSATKDGHTYVGRSYDFHHEQNDLRLCTVRIKRRVKHIGFTELLLGRDDGMNEYGFCVTFSGGGTFKREPSNRGFNFFLIVRTLLDNCKTVTDAVGRLRKTPISGFWNFLVTDKNGNSALLQFFDGEFEAKQISNRSNEKCLFSTNHYMLPEMVRYQQYAGDWILKNSKKRYELINKTLSAKMPRISKEDIRKLLSEEMYNGLCAHYYTDYFGTLFSIIYNLTELKTEICFGAPTHNSWQKPFSLDDPVGINHFSTVFPDKSIKTDELWNDA